MKTVRLFLLTLGLTGHCFARQNPTDISMRLDELMQAYADVNQFNGCILVSKGNKIVYEKAFGYSNVGSGKKNETRTLFRIYSVTKTFTSTVVFKLAEEGRLGLDDRLSKFYPGFPKGDSITIRHLLTHTSGIYDYTRGNDMKDETEASFIRFLSSKPLDFSPGKGWSYSNSGYWMLGFIIEKVSGVSYEEAVKKYIFNTCSMNHSGFDFKTLKDPRKATGYAVFSGEEKRVSEDIDPPGPYAAGAIYSTVGDLYRYYNAHQSFRLISRSSLEKAWTPDTLNQHYGYGWQLKEFEGRRVIYHGGGGPGFRSNFSFIPADSISVILLTNNNNTNLDALTATIFRLMYHLPYKKPFEIKVGQQRLSACEGYYLIDSLFSLHIQREGGRLTARATGQGGTILLAEKNNLFYSLDAEAYVEFIADSSGAYNALFLRSAYADRLKQGKRYIPSWGILGSATAIGWEGGADIALSERPAEKGVWEIKNISLKKGVFKFRFNNDWNENYGMGEDNRKLVLYGKDIHVEQGVYNMVLDVRVADNAKFLIERVN